MRCDCGRRHEDVPCRQYQQELRERAGGKPLPLGRLPTLPCDDTCERDKRLRGLAEAMGLRRDHQYHQETFWAPEIFAAARRRPLADIVAWERQLHTFLQGDKPNLLLNLKARERDFVRELAVYYGIDGTALEKSLYLTKSSASAVPTPLLSAALQTAGYDPAAQVTQRLQRTPGCALVLDPLPPSAREAEVREHLRGYLGKYALRWHSPTTCVVLFHTNGLREDALQALKKAKCPYAAAPFTAAAFPEVYRALFDGTA